MSNASNADNIDKNSSASEQRADSVTEEVSAEQVANYLREHGEFFIGQEDLLAEISLPHESGNAISLLERQVTILRDRGIDARQKLSNLLENARDNDQLFDTTRNLVLALLRSENITELSNVTQDQLSNHTNIDACEIIIVDHPKLKVAKTVRTATSDFLQKEFADVFRLRRTHCGALGETQINYLFPAHRGNINSTAVCPVNSNGKILALLAFGNKSDSYFNTQLDTLFLDFIGQVVGAVLDKELTRLDLAKS